MEVRVPKRIGLLEIWAYVAAIGVLWSTTRDWPSPTTRQLPIEIRLGAFAGSATNVYFVLFWLVKKVPILYAVMTSMCLALGWTVVAAVHISTFDLAGHPLWLGIPATVVSTLIIQRRLDYSWKDSFLSALAGAGCLLILWSIVFTALASHHNT